jgi:hypothetical protein
MRFVSALLIAAALFTLPACAEKESPMEEAKDAVGDAMDSRPGEPLRDAAEDIGDAAKEAGEAVADAAGELTDQVQEAAK